jgi:hypothetical protein
VVDVVVVVLVAASVVVVVLVATVVVVVSVAPSPAGTVVSALAVGARRPTTHSAKTRERTKATIRRAIARTGFWTATVCISLRNSTQRAQILVP